MKLLLSKLSATQIAIIVFFIAVAVFADKALIGLADVTYRLYSDDMQGWIVILACIMSTLIMSYASFYLGPRRVILGDITD